MALTFTESGVPLGQHELPKRRVTYNADIYTPSRANASNGCKNYISIIIFISYYVALKFCSYIIIVFCLYDIS